IVCTFSGFVVTMLHANNYDQLLALAVLPLAAAVSLKLEWGDWKSAAVLGGLNAALVLIYTELSPVAAMIPALILSWRLWDERPVPRAVLLSVSVSLLVIAVATAPVASDVWRFFQRQLAEAAAIERPGETFFLGFFDPRCVFGSFAMLYAPFVGCPQTLLASFS